MNNEFLAYLFLSGLFLALFTVAEWLYHFARLKAEYTRKLVHIGTGLLTLLFPLYFSHILWVALLCGSFLVLLLLSRRFHFLKSINAIDRVSVGSIVYPVIVLICFYAYQLKAHDNTGPAYRYFYLPILTMALCDPAAALIGKHFPWKPYTIMGQTKTASGSLAFALLSIVLCCIFLPHESVCWFIVTSILIALVSTVTEGLSQKGYDNFTIPLSVLVILYGCEQWVPAS